MPTTDPTEIHTRAIAAITDAHEAEEAEEAERQHQLSIEIGKVIKSLHQDDMTIEQVKKMQEFIAGDYQLTPPDSALQQQITDLEQASAEKDAANSDMRRQLDALRNGNVVELPPTLSDDEVVKLTDWINANMYDRRGRLLHANLDDMALRPRTPAAPITPPTRTTPPGPPTSRRSPTPPPTPPTPPPSGKPGFMWKAVDSAGKALSSRASKKVK
jgi:hypothetical protein